MTHAHFSLTVSSRTRVLVGYYKSSGVVPAFVPAPCRRRCPIPFFIDTSQLILLCICARSVPPPVPDPTADSGRRRQTAADGSRQRQTAADGGRRRQMAADGGSHFHRHLSTKIHILEPEPEPVPDRCRNGAGEPDPVPDRNRIGAGSVPDRCRIGAGSHFH